LKRYGGDIHNFRDEKERKRVLDKAGASEDEIADFTTYYKQQPEFTATITGVPSEEKKDIVADKEARVKVEVTITNFDLDLVKQFCEIESFCANDTVEGATIEHTPNLFLILSADNLLKSVTSIKMTDFLNTENPGKATAYFKYVPEKAGTLDLVVKGIHDTFTGVGFEQIGFIHVQGEAPVDSD